MTALQEHLTQARDGAQFATSDLRSALTTAAPQLAADLLAALLDAEGLVARLETLLATTED